MHILIAPDSFKGTLSAREAAAAMARGVKSAIPDADVLTLPVGDGGEGTADAIAQAFGREQTVKKIVCDTLNPLGHSIKASYYLTSEGAAVIESAAASGLTLVPTASRDIMKADTRGTGLLIADAYRRGARDFYICMGGTGTCDAGYGAFEAMNGPDMTDATFTLLCDVDNPLLGSKGAAPVFAPQKGATPEMIPLLESRLAERAAFYRSLTGTDIASTPFSGAAGGLAGMLMACYGASPVKGIEKVLDMVGFDRLLDRADLVITGEGRADLTTLHGKAPLGIMRAARRRGVPVILIAGSVADTDELIKAGFTTVAQATPVGKVPDESASSFLESATASLLKKRIT